jgi:hypothetical protein
MLRQLIAPVRQAGRPAVMRIGAIFWAAMLLTLPALAQTGTRPVFAPGSFWYRPVPRDVALDPNSANYVSEFLRQLHAYYGTVGISTTAYSSPVYAAGPDVPAQPVAQWDCHKSGYVDRDLTRQWAAVPIPSYAQPADGTDAEMTIYQPSTDRMWEFWRARRVGGQWQACWGGGMQNVSRNAGIWAPHYGAAATGLPFAPGQITVDDLRSGAIRHVMGIALVDAQLGSVLSWPANRSDGYNPKNAPNRIPEGTRFRLDPSVNVDALPIHPVAKMVAKAAQTYGFVVWDKGGSISLRFQNPKDFTLTGKDNPYPQLWNGTPSYKILAGIPWDRLQFLPSDYGKS